PTEVRFIDGDTDRVGFGMGTMGSRSTVIGGTALTMAADKVIAKGRKIAAKMLEAAEEDITFADARFGVKGTDRSVGLKGGARARAARGVGGGGRGGSSPPPPAQGAGSGPSPSGPPPPPPPIPGRTAA